MIQLTRLNNTPLAVNSDLIKYIEEAPDTVITLLNGEKLLVRETTAEVIDRVRAFRRSVLTDSAPVSVTVRRSALVNEAPGQTEEAAKEAIRG